MAPADKNSGHKKQRLDLPRKIRNLGEETLWILPTLKPNKALRQPTLDSGDGLRNWASALCTFLSAGAICTCIPAKFVSQLFKLIADELLLQATPAQQAYSLVSKGKEQELLIH